MSRESLGGGKAWSVGRPPTSYGAVADESLCRLVRVRTGASLREVKLAILAAYEHQYTPEQITLYSRVYDDEPTRVTTDRAAANRLLSYKPDWEEVQRGDPDRSGSVLLVVSPYLDETEANLLVLPAAHSAPPATLEAHLSTPADAGGVVSDPLPARLASVAPELFDPFPLPSHVDDWLAQYREAPQSVADLVGGPRAAATKGRDVIYVQPVHCVVTDGKAFSKGKSSGKGKGKNKEAEAADDASADAPFFDKLTCYLQAFFLGTPVRLLPPLTVRVSVGKGSLLGTPVAWRNWCPGNEQAMPHGQLNAAALLRALKPRIHRGGIVPGSGALPSDGFCVLGVTMTDIYCDDDDVFTAGLASIAERAGCFSFYRYKAGAASPGELLHRACKTAAHELLHMYGIGHCVHRSCLMNGSGHLLQDLAAPPHLCPVDLSKLKAALGQSCGLRARYEALLAFCEAQASGFGAQAEWLHRAIAAVDNTDVGKENVSTALGKRKAAPA